ncbi:hypothetical protein BE221DRAFT_190971, partial [Ostreococcus tauri]
MKRLSYETHIVPHKKRPLVFSQEQIEEFGRLNKLAIQNMMATLEVENPGDAARRKHQAEVLSLPAQLIAWKDEHACIDVGDVTDAPYPHEWPKDAHIYG